MTNPVILLGFHPTPAMEALRGRVAALADAARDAGLDLGAKPVREEP